MGVFNDVHEEAEPTVTRFSIVSSEYARRKDLVNYLHKGSNRVNIVNSDIDMSNNKIINVGEPRIGGDVVSKEFLLKRIQNTVINKYDLEKLPGKWKQVNDSLTNLREKLRENKKVIRVNEINVMKALDDLVKLENVEKDIVKKLGGEIKKGVERIKEKFEELQKNVIENDELENELQKLIDDYRPKFEGLAEQFKDLETVMTNDVSYLNDKFKELQTKFDENRFEFLETSIGKVKDELEARLTVAETKLIMSETNTNQIVRLMEDVTNLKTSKPRLVGKYDIDKNVYNEDWSLNYLKWKRGWFDVKIGGTYRFDFEVDAGATIIIRKKGEAEPIGNVLIDSQNHIFNIILDEDESISFTIITHENLEIHEAIKKFKIYYLNE